MNFEEKHALIRKTVGYYADDYRMFTADDLVNEAWLNKQVREADEPKRVVKATEDACVNFLRRWYKTGADHKKRDIRIVPVGVLSKEMRDNMCEYEQDNTTELLKEDLYKQMSEEERKIVEYRLQGYTYKEIAAAMYYNKVRMIHRKMKDKMSKMREQLLGD